MPSTQMSKGLVGPVDAWLSAARLGDNDAFGQAMETCRQYLMLVADRELNQKLRPKGGASDIVQETFLDAQCDFDQFRGRTEPELRSWLLRILRNNVQGFVRHYRQSKRNIAREIPLGGGDEGGPMVAEEQLPARTETPSRHAIHREQALCLAQGLERLPERARHIVLWRHQEHCTFEEIGRRLGVSAEAARMSWARAIRRLQQELADPGSGATPEGLRGG